MTNFLLTLGAALALVAATTAYEVQTGSADKDKLYDFLDAKNMLQTQGCATCETHAPTPSPTPPPTFSAGTKCTLQMGKCSNFDTTTETCWETYEWTSATSSEDMILKAKAQSIGDHVENGEMCSTAWTTTDGTCSAMSRIAGGAYVNSVRITHDGPAGLFPNKACCVRLYTSTPQTTFDVCSTYDEAPLVFPFTSSIPCYEVDEFNDAGKRQFSIGCGLIHDFPAGDFLANFFEVTYYSSGAPEQETTFPPTAPPTPQSGF